MVTVTAREASRGFADLLDHVEHDGEEYTVVRDGKPVARIVPLVAHTVARFLDRRALSASTDEDFAADALSAHRFLTLDVSDPWHD